MAKNLTDIMEDQEVIQKLVDKGYGPLVDAFLMNEGLVYTKKGRLNKCGACRVLGWKTKQLEDALRECKDLLEPEFPAELDSPVQPGRQPRRGNG